jgi:hypothetical protein
MKLYQALLLFGLSALVIGAVLQTAIPDPPKGMSFGIGLSAALLAWKVTKKC